MCVVLALVAQVGCGARWTDEQADIVAGRDTVAASADAGRVSASGRGESSSGDGGTTGRTANPTATTQRSGGAGSGGGEEANGGEAGDGQATASGAGGGSSGPLPCGAPSDAPGVTDSEINVGSINSLSGPVPGLGGSAAAASRAYVAYRNSVGGVCGRQIVLKEADDGSDNGRYRSVIDEFKDTVFGIAGGFAFGDVGGAEIVQTSGIPIVNAPTAQNVADIPNVGDINPKFENTDASTDKYEFIRDQGGTKASLTYIAVDQSRAEANLHRSLMEAAGIEIVQVQELPLSTLNYDAAARAVANSGANYLFFIGDTNSNVSMTQSMADTGYELDFFEIFTFGYGSSYLRSAGPAAEGVTSFLRSLPNEEAGSNEELARFNEWMGRVAPSEPRDPFAADSWASAKAFFDTLEALPGPISRQAWTKQLRSIGTYDAAGFFGPIRLGAELTNGCVVAMTVTGGKWVRQAPQGGGFLC